MLSSSFITGTTASTSFSASSTFFITLSETYGLAPSWIRTNSAVTRSRARFTVSVRVLPPKITVTFSYPSKSERARAKFSSFTATIIFSRPEKARKGNTEFSSTVRPFTVQKSLLRLSEKRELSPAAGIITSNISRRSPHTNRLRLPCL